MDAYSGSALKDKSSKNIFFASRFGHKITKPQNSFGFYCYLCTRNILWTNEKNFRTKRKENEDKRAIFINAIRKNNTTIIKVENYCSELIEFENGLPLSKEDSIYHGYGTKSIDYIAKKYGGYCLFEQKNNIFSVTICFFKWQLRLLR